MEYLRVLLTSVGSVIVLFFLTKLLGYRQISELSVFDYINSITIGSIAASLAGAEGFREASYHLIAMLIFAAATYSLSKLTDRSLRLRAWITGRELPLLEGGRLRRENLARAKLDLHELLAQCRSQGCFSLRELEHIRLLPNGKLGILPKSQFRPATPSDLSVAVPRTGVPASVITDGVISEEALKAAGIDRRRLTVLLSEQGYRNASEVFYAEIEKDGTMTAFPMKPENQ